MDVADLHELVERLRTVLSAEDYAKLETAVDALGYLQELVADQTMTMAELRRLVVVQPGTETPRLVLQRAGLEDPTSHRAATAPRRMRAHGRLLWRTRRCGRGIGVPSVRKGKCTRNASPNG